MMIVDKLESDGKRKLKRYSERSGKHLYEKTQVKFINRRINRGTQRLFSVKYLFGEANTAYVAFSNA